MVDYGLCHGLTQIAMPQAIYLKPKLQSAKHLVSLDAYNFFHCYNNHWSIFIKFKHFQHQYYQNSFTSRNHYHTLNYKVHSHQYYQNSFTSRNHYHTLNYRVQSHHLCNLNELFRYSLVHECIIVPPFPSIEHFRKPIDHDYHLHALTILYS